MYDHRWCGFPERQSQYAEIADEGFWALVEEAQNIGGAMGLPLHWQRGIKSAILLRACGALNMDILQTTKISTKWQKGHLADSDAQLRRGLYGCSYT